MPRAEPNCVSQSGTAGGPEFSEAEVKAIAAEYEVTGGPDDYGDMFERPALPKDRLVEPYPNEKAARAAMAVHTRRISH